MALSPLNSNQITTYPLQNNAFSTFNTEAQFQPAQQSQSRKDVFVNINNNTEKKVLIGAGILAAATAAALLIYNVVNKGKGTQAVDELKDVIQNKGIKFNKGVATLENGSKFEGVIEGSLKGGGNIKLEYKDGKVVNSITDKFTKTYKYNPAGALDEVCTKKAGELPCYYFRGYRNISDYKDGLPIINGEPARIINRDDSQSGTIIRRLGFKEGYDAIFVDQKNKTPYFIKQEGEITSYFNKGGKLSHTRTTSKDGKDFLTKIYPDDTKYENSLSGSKIKQINPDGSTIYLKNLEGGLQNVVITEKNGDKYNYMIDGATTNLNLTNNLKTNEFYLYKDGNISSLDKDGKQVNVAKNKVSEIISHLKSSIEQTKKLEDIRIELSSLPKIQ